MQCNKQIKMFTVLMKYTCVYILNIYQFIARIESKAFCDITGNNPIVILNILKGIDLISTLSNSRKNGISPCIFSLN